MSPEQVIGLLLFSILVIGIILIITLIITHAFNYSSTIKTTKKHSKINYKFLNKHPINQSFKKGLDKD